MPLPPADIGQTYILAGEGGPGAVVEVLGSGYGADPVNDGRGRSVSGNPSQRVASLVVHPIYTSRHRALGAFIGGDVVVPLVRLKLDVGDGRTDTRTGVGDVTISPFLQWIAPRGSVNGLSVRVAMQIAAPTGARSLTRTANIGAGAWQVSPYVAVTKRFLRDWETSARFIFDHTGTADGDGSERPSMRAGDFAVLNVALSRAVSPTARFGIGGYVLEQTGRSRIGGDRQDGLQQVFALGPMTRWAFGRTFLLAAAYAEFAARDRPQGLSANLRLQHLF